MSSDFWFGTVTGSLVTFVILLVAAVAVAQGKKEGS